ncbi:hypothetical protein Tco_0092260 [Tanacetum coccineum]
MYNNIMAAGSRDHPPMLATGRYAQWFYKMMNEMQTVDLDKESYHKLFDILKQYQKEVNEIRAEKIARNANPLALVVAAQQYLNTYYQAPKPHKSYAPPSKQSFSTRSHASTRYKGKEIAKPIIPPSESASEEDNDPEQAQRDKDMYKNLALIAKYFKKIYQPTNNNLITSSNTKNKNVDTSPRYKNDNQTGKFGNQRTVTVVGARETVGSQVVQQTGIQCFNCKEFRHFAKKRRKPKRAKDYTYHKHKMLLCKQAEKGVPLQAEQADWLEDMDEEVDKQELEAHYSFMAKIQEVLPADSGSDAEPLEKVQYDAEYNVFANKRQHSKKPESINNTCVVEKVDSNVILGSSDMCDNDNQADQNAKECDVEHVVLANLIANLKLDTDENKNIQKQLKKANTSLSHELQECKSALKECKSILDESNKSRDRYLVALHDKEVKLEKYKIFKDRTIEKDTLEHKLKETLGLLAQKEHDINEGLLKEKNKSIQTIHMLVPKSSTYNGRPTFVNPMYLKKAQSEMPCFYEIPYNKDDLANILAPGRDEILTLEQESRLKLNKDKVKPYDYTKQNSLYEIFKPPSREYLDQLAHANEIRKKM